MTQNEINDIMMGDLMYGLQWLITAQVLVGLVLIGFRLLIQWMDKQ